MEAIRPVPRTLLRDRAYAAIRDAIVAGEIEPGAVVRDAELAERLGLSRAPVRVPPGAVQKNFREMLNPMNH